MGQKLTIILVILITFECHGQVSHLHKFKGKWVNQHKTEIGVYFRDKIWL